ncbi:MAG: hypothetical protein IT184_14230 [Acidobacteria bacterium]|nr:hypothetical protein [Acidobacteriota bacterium]
MAVVRRLAVLAVLLVFTTGHAGLCGVAASFARQTTTTAAASTCPLHRPEPSRPSIAAGGDTAAMSCCAPAERREDTHAAPPVTTAMSGEPADYRVGLVLPLPPPDIVRAPDDAPPKAVATYLLLSVFLV